MPGFFLPLAQTADLFGALRYKEFSQRGLLSIYKSISGDARYDKGACAGITHALVAHHIKSHDLFAFIDELENDISALSEFSFDTKKLTEAFRGEILALKDKVLGILHAQDDHQTLPLHWEKDLSLKRLNSADDSHIKSVRKWQGKIKTLLLTSINGYVPLVYTAACDENGREISHIVLLSCMIEKGVLQFVYFDPSEGVLVWDDIHKFFNYLDARLSSIIENSERLHAQSKIISLTKKIKPLKEGHLIQTANYSEEATYFSSDVCRWLEWSLKEPSQQKNLATLCQHISFEAYVQLYNKEPVLTRALLTQLPELRKRLDTFITPNFLSKIDPEVYRFVDSIKSSSDCLPLVELVLQAPSESDAVLDVFSSRPEQLNMLLMNEKLRDALGKKKSLFLQSAGARETWRNSVSSDRELQKIPVYASTIEAMMSSLSDAQKLTFFQGALKMKGLEFSSDEEGISNETFLTDSFRVNAQVPSRP